MGRLAKSALGLLVASLLAWGSAPASAGALSAGAPDRTATRTAPSLVRLSVSSHRHSITRRLHARRHAHSHRGLAKSRLRTISASGSPGAPGRRLPHSRHQSALPGFSFSIHSHHGSKAGGRGVAIPETRGPSAHRNGTRLAQGAGLGTLKARANVISGRGPPRAGPPSGIPREHPPVADPTGSPNSLLSTTPPHPSFQDIPFHPSLTTISGRSLRALGPMVRVRELGTVGASASPLPRLPLGGHGGVTFNPP
jgi:hypothetical protein